MLMQNHPVMSRLLDAFDLGCAAVRKALDVPSTTQINQVMSGVGGNTVATALVLKELRTRMQAQDAGEYQVELPDNVTLDDLQAAYQTIDQLIQQFSDQKTPPKRQVKAPPAPPAPPES